MADTLGTINQFDPTINGRSIRTGSYVPTTPVGNRAGPLSRSGPRHPSPRPQPNSTLPVQARPRQTEATASSPFVASEKIKLVEEGNNNRRYVILDVTPEFSESKNVQYAEISEIRAAGSILIFIASPGRTFSINAKLISRTPEEASQNFAYLHTMKSWGQPDLDYTNALKDVSVPRTIRIYAYGQNVKGVPTAMKSITVDFPTDVDYIPTVGNTAKMPIICNVSMSFQETRTAEELQAFDILKYKSGQLNWW